MPAQGGRDKIPTDGGHRIGHNPFAGLSLKGLAPGPPAPIVPALSGSAPPSPAGRNRGRVDIIRETQDRGGKTVTVAANFVGIGTPEKEKLAREIRTACGCGGTVKDGRIVIQGDQRVKVAQILAAAGFRPVFAGG
jgi:translation initiation factor 1